MKAYERLMRYAVYPTVSRENSDAIPSTPSQLIFGKVLVEELKALGLSDAYQNEKGFVYGTLEANTDCNITLGLLAHMDVSDAVPCENPKLSLIPDYDGEDVRLADGLSVLSPKDFPFLKNFKGKTLLVTDGTTLLGADDKAGIAEIMTAVEILQKNSSVKHGKIRICFTPDEEIGTGILSIDPAELGVDYAYTVDGSGFGEVDYETFNASSAHVVFHGRSIHPGGAKDKMINASRVAFEFDSLLPEAQRPEHTAGREGFFHLTDMQGSVEDASLDYIIRDHDFGILKSREATLQSVTDFLNNKYGSGTVELLIQESYRNMAEKILPHSLLIDKAYQVIRSMGAEPVSHPVRGGTDGSRLSFMGVPCPNLGTGSYNHHGRLEFAVTEEMDKVTDFLTGLITKFAE